MEEDSSNNSAADVEEIDPESSVTEAATRTRRRKAKVYEYFEEKDDRFMCKTCRFLVAKEKKGSTGNLHKHLQNHASVYESMKNGATEVPQKQQTIQDSFKNAPYSAEKLERLIVEHIILTDQPFTIVEDESFLKLLLHGRPNAPRIVKADAIKLRIEKLFDSEREKLITKMENVPGKVSVIVDGWRSINRHSFQGIIVTWISTDWEFEQIVLDFDVLNGRHTGKTLALSLHKVLSDFRICNKLLGVTTDNAANMCTMLVELETLLAAENEGFDAKGYHIRCLAHIINLACQSSLQIIKAIAPMNVGEDESSDSDASHDEELQSAQISTSVYFRVRRTIQKVRKCDYLTDKLKKFCESFCVTPLEPILDVRVRWNSTYEMLKRALHLKKPLDSLMRDSPELERWLLAESEWGLVKEMVDFLEPFARMTRQISVHKTPTLSMAAAVYVELYRHTGTYKGNEFQGSEDVQKAAAAAESKLDDYYGKSDATIYVVGLTLDPRCKLKWYQSVGFGHLTSSFKKIVSDVWKKEYKPSNAEKEKSPEPENLFDLQMKRARFDSKDELEKYLSELPVKSSAMPLGILNWWKEHEAIFPNLSKMARDYLAASATGVPIEATFSMGTDLLTCKRRKLSPQTIRMCMALKAWMKFASKEEYRSSCNINLAEKMNGGLD